MGKTEPEFIQPQNSMDQKAVSWASPMYFDKRKRHRRTASEIERHYRCPVPNCLKSYGSEGSLSQHIKLKHKDYPLEGTKHQITSTIQPEPPSPQISNNAPLENNVKNKPDQLESSLPKDPENPNNTGNGEPTLNMGNPQQLINLETIPVTNTIEPTLPPNNIEVLPNDIETEQNFIQPIEHNINSPVIEFREDPPSPPSITNLNDEIPNI